MGNNQSAQASGSSASFRPGDKVKVSAKSAEELERLLTGHGGYNKSMSVLVGKIGVITKQLGSLNRHDVMVKFPLISEKAEFRFNPAALERSHLPTFSIGETVRLITDEGKVKKLQVGHGNWVDSMRAALGEKARVIKNYLDGDIRVKMIEGPLGLVSQELTLNPFCVTTAGDTAGGGDHASSSSDSSDIDPSQLIRLLRRMLQSDKDEDEKEGERATTKPHKMMTENGTLSQLYENKRYLGHGAFGVVIKADHYLENGASCAIKVVGFDRGELGDVLKEVHSLASLTTHPHIVSYKGCWIEKLSEAKVEGLDERLKKVRTGSTPELILCVRLECCQGNLDDYLNNRNGRFFLEDKFKSTRELRDRRNFTDSGYTTYKAVFIDVLKGLKFLHDKNIIHRDIKPANILYDKNMDFKLTDFGLAKHVEYQGLMSNCGTLGYAAPEQILCKRYDLRADIYPMGLVLFELMYPIKETDELVSLFKDLRSDQQLPPGLERCYPEVSKLIIQMIDNDAKARPTLERLLSISWRDL